MIDIKNRTRETKVYQYPRDVSAGPVRPQSQKVHREHFNPKNGEKTRVEKTVALGGVLTLPPKGEIKQLPDALLDHPVLQRDIKARNVSIKQYKASTSASTAPSESHSGRGRAKTRRNKG